MFRRSTAWASLASGCVPQQIGADEAVEVTVEHALRVSGLAGQLGLALLLAQLGDTRPEDAQRRLLVRRLRALVLALDDDSCRQMREPHRGIRLVDVLTAGA